MSHFTVLVTLTAQQIADANGDVDEALAKAMAPYKEYGCGSPDTEESKKYLEWKDKEAEYLAEYNGEKEFGIWELVFSSEVMLPAVQRKYNLTDEQMVPIKEEIDRYKNSRNEGVFSSHDSNRDDCQKNVYKLLKSYGVEKLELTAQEIYETFADYVSDWHSEKPEEGTPTPYGYWNNPNDKWDWYQVGGRWAGYLAKHSINYKDMPEPEEGPYGLGVDYPEYIKRKDINVKNMKLEAEENARSWWIKFERVQPYLDDTLSLSEQSRNKLFSNDSNNEFFNFVWDMGQTFEMLGWNKYVLPEFRLKTAKEKLQELAQLHQLAGGGTKVDYPDVYEHDWGEMPTAELVRAVEGTKFIPNQHIIGRILRERYGDDEGGKLLEKSKVVDNTIDFLESLSINWEEELQGDSVADHVFIERKRIKLETPSLESVLKNKYIWEWGTYAVLDTEGWKSKGEMGWFGCGSETAESSIEFKKSYIETFIEQGDPEDTLVLVDCHI